MYSYRNVPPSYQSTLNPMHTERSNTQQLMQSMTRLEQQMNYLLKLIEYNNQLLRTIEQQQNKVTTTGGAVIVRM